MDQNALTSSQATPLLIVVSGAVVASSIALLLKVAVTRRMRDSDMSEISTSQTLNPKQLMLQARENADFDPHRTDPGLLRKHSTFKTYQTQYATYTNVRTFYRPHPQIDKLPSKPDPIPVLVFVHGLGGSLAQFKSVLTSLVDLAPCLGVDLPGCGRSDFAPITWPAYEPTALAELLRVVIEEHVNVGQGYILLGHSLGCSLAAQTALSSLCGRRKGAEVLGLIGICPASQAPAGRAATVLKALLHIPDPLFDLWRAWDKRGGPHSASVARFVGEQADIEVKRLQERFNGQSRTPVYRRMAWGLFPHGRNSPGMAGLDTWARLKIPIYLIGGEGDAVTPVKNLTSIAQALGRTVKSLPQANGSSGGFFEDAPNDQLQPAGDQDAKHDSELTLFGPASSPLPLRFTHRSPVLKTSILPFPASHGLLYDPATSRTLSGLIQGFLPTHIDSRLSLGWQLQQLSIDGKWDVKNLEKWRLVPPVSEPIACIFRAMKTLREIDDQHAPEQFVNQWGGRIKAVIDISHDSPVYNSQGLEDGGVEYHKFPTVSKIPPTRDETREFAILVDQLRTKFGIAKPARKNSSAVSNAGNKIDQLDETSAWIGVHCHYGFNRTGFFICSYLIEREGYGVQTAIDGFAAARPPGIKHPHFLDELFVRYCVGLKRADTMT